MYSNVTSIEGSRQCGCQTSSTAGFPCQRRRSSAKLQLRKRSILVSEVSFGKGRPPLSGGRCPLRKHPVTWILPLQGSVHDAQQSGGVKGGAAFLRTAHGAGPGKDRRRTAPVPHGDERAVATALAWGLSLPSTHKWRY